VTKPLPRSLTDLQDASRPLVERRGELPPRVTMLVQAWWEMRDGGPPLHIDDLRVNPQMRKDVVDQRGLTRVLRKMQRAYKAAHEEWLFAARGLQ